MNQENFQYFKSTDSVTFKYERGGKGILGEMFHPNFEIYYLISGNVSFNYKGRISKVKKGDLIIIYPGTYHSFKVNGSFNDYCRCVFTFSRNFLEIEKLDSCFSTPEKYLIQNSKEVKEIISRLINYVDEKYNDDFNYLLKSCFTELALIVKYQNQDFTEKTHNETVSSLVSQILNYIDQNVFKEITLESISKFTYSSISQICHHFKNELKMSIKQYITQKRMVEANYLMSKGYKITEIAKMVGYSDYSVFYRNYKNYREEKLKKDNIKED